jgi:cytochrome c556
MSGGFGKGGALALALSIGAAVAAGGALAHDTAGEKPTTPGGRAALARHDNYERLGQAFKSINDELKKGKPNRGLIARNAVTVNTLSAQIPTWFPKGSGQEARPKSEAKAEIWTDAAGFSAAAANLRAQTAKLQQVSNGGELGALKTQARETGAACKACHKKFRVEKEKT